MLRTNSVQKPKAKAATTIPQSTRKTRTATNSLPCKPERLIEEALSTTPKKATPKKATPKKAAPKKATPKKATPTKVTSKKATPTKKATPKKAPAKKATTPKVLKPKVSTKVTKKKSPVKPKAKAAAATTKTPAVAAAAAGKKKAAPATKMGKRRPRMAEEALPAPVGYDDSSELHEAFKRGVYRTAEGWFDMKKMEYLGEEEADGVEIERGIDV
jgi:hypothetical protein